MYDLNAELIAQTTVTATITGATLNTGTGSPTRGWRNRFLVQAYSAATTGTAAGTFVGTIQVSSDGTTWRTATTGKTATLATAAALWEETLPLFESPNEPYQRAVVTVTAGTSSAIALNGLEVDLGDAQVTPRA